MNRVTLWQLLVWLTGCGVYFAALRGMLPQEQRPLWGDLMLSLLAAGVGLGWVGVIQVLQLSPRSGAARLRRDPSDATPAPSPGTWLLAAMGLIAAADLIVDLAFPKTTARAQVLRQIATCLIFLWPTLSRHLPRVWRYYFLLLALHEAARLVTSCLVVMNISVPSAMMSLTDSWVRSVVALIGLAGVIALDRPERQERQPRDWLHFAGLVVGATFFVARALI